jgi:hypothetical protein
MVNRTSKRKSPRSPARADWKPVGAEVPPELYDALVAEAKENGVGQATIQRWALETYLSHRLEADK